MSVFINIYLETQFSMYLLRTSYASTFCYTSGMGNTVPKWNYIFRINYVINILETGINPCPCYIIKYSRLSLRTYVSYKRGEGSNKVSKGEMNVDINILMKDGAQTTKLCQDLVRVVCRKFTSAPQRKKQYGGWWARSGHNIHCVLHTHSTSQFTPATS